MFDGMKTAPFHNSMSAVPVFADFEGVADLDRYAPLPDGWTMAIADIVDSTGAIGAGHYKSVNMAAAAVISAVLNGLGNLDLPYVFGGDGAAIAVPPDGTDAARTALAAVSRWSAESFGLEMRAALVPVEAIRKAGHDVKVARFQAGPEVSFAMFAGGGSSWAEARMKDGQYLVPGAPPGAMPDLTGLSCRWSPVKSQLGQIVSIIALPGPAADEDSFGALVSDVVEIAGDEERESHPIPRNGPRLRFSLRGIATEAKTRSGLRARLRSGVSAVFESILLFALYRLNIKAGAFDARAYAQDVALNTDFRKYDDGLKMTLDLDAGRLARIEARLAEAESAGICLYGLHKQAEALVTCIVPSPVTRDHMHFVDGAAGGYAEAAARIKRHGRQPHQLG